MFMSCCHSATPLDELTREAVISTGQPARDTRCGCRSLVHIAGPQPPISNCLIFEADLIWPVPRWRRCSLAAFGVWEFAGNWGGNNLGFWEPNWNFPALCCRGKGVITGSEICDPLM